MAQQLASLPPKNVALGLLDRVQIGGWTSVEFPGTESLLALAETLGRPTPASRGGPLVTCLEPRAHQEAPRNSLSSRYGQGSFPFHSDAAHTPFPPRYVLLRLVGDVPSSRPTFIAPLVAFELSDKDRDLLEYEVWLVNGGRGKFLTSLLDFDVAPHEHMLRFDLGCMRPALDSFGRSAVVLRRACKRLAISWQWNPGFVLVIDNWRSLHSRGGRPRVQENRMLERVLVTAE